jgi:hypothetical protein
MQDSIKCTTTVLLFTLWTALTGCSGGADLPQYSLGGTVNGLAADHSLVLQSNGTDNLTVTRSGAFMFAAGFAPGSSYVITVLTQPAGQTCSVSNGSGALPGPTSVLGVPAAHGVSNIVVNCSAGSGPFTISGAVTGLLPGNSLVLEDNGGNDLTVSANTSFTFSAALAAGKPYAVTISTQPAGQSCAITDGSGGAILADVNNVRVTCSDDTFNVGAAVSGLASGATLVLQLNGGDNLTLTANGNSNFSKPIADGSSYAVTILTQPHGETCVVSHGSGTVAAMNITVPVTCSANGTPPPDTFTIGGTVSGLAGSAAVVLEDNGGNATTVSGNHAFTFSTAIASGDTYSVTVSTQPAGYNCVVSHGSGTVASADVTNVVVACSALTYTVGGTVTGLSGTVVLQNNGMGSLSITANGSFTFPTPLASGATYAVSVLTQPSGQTCSLTGAAGTVQAADVNSVLVTCAAATGNGNFIWRGGSKLPNGAGTYGTLKTPSASNLPPARDEAAYWTDAAGNYWLFGGENVPDGEYFLNDLWMYSPASGEWTWEGGSTATNQAGVYGTQGTAAAGNVPGSRRAASFWVDASGNFWLFGGYGCNASGGVRCEDELNDLWEFTPSTGLWTWVGGSTAGYANGVYGTQGQAAAGNIPGSRWGAPSWTDASGNLWLLGGNAIDKNGNFGRLNDLWKFSPASKQWTWVGGSDTYNGPVESVYGTPGQAGTGAWPGANELAAATMDASGNFWLFGGAETGQTAGEVDFTNDLWKYSPASGEWTSYPGANGNYGTLGSGTAMTFPPGRQSAMAWQDAAGNFWIYGGWGEQGLYGDLWEFSPSTGFWTWIGGSSSLTPTVSYGTLGTPASTNTPGGREASAIWLDSSGDLWLFGGGEGFSPMFGVAAGVDSDLWEILP